MHPLSYTGGDEVAAVVKKIAHRGAWGYSHENTLDAFRKAIEYDVDMIEMDVYKCATGEPVVIHYNRLEWTTNSFGFVRLTDPDTLAQVDAGGGEGVPTLREALDIIDRDAEVIIELKRGSAARPVIEVVSEYVDEHGWSYDDFLVSSFFPHALRTVEKTLPEVRTGATMYGLRLDYHLFNLLTDMDVVLTHRWALTEEFVDQIHANGHEVYAWTIFRTTDDIDWLKDIGVDGIAVNRPDKF